MRILSMLLVGLLAGIAAPSDAAVSPEQVTLTWTPDPTPGLQYRLRLRHFAQPDWFDLGLADAAAGQFVYQFAPALPNEPTTDRWICADAQGVAADGTVGLWYSEVHGSAACNQVEAGSIVVPPPPPPPPLPPPPAGLSIGAATPDEVVITASTADCPRVQTSTAGSTKLVQKRTVRCLR